MSVERGKLTECRRYSELAAIGFSSSAWRAVSRHTFTWLTRGGTRSFGLSLSPWQMYEGFGITN